MAGREISRLFREIPEGDIFGSIADHDVRHNQTFEYNLFKSNQSGLLSM
jgi:hypothetical protein